MAFFMIMVRAVFCSAGFLPDGFLRFSFITFCVFNFVGFKIGIRAVTSVIHNYNFVLIIEVIISISRM